MPLEFSEKAHQQIERLLKCYPTRQATLLGVLYVAQDEFGFLSEEALELVSRTLDLPLSHVFGVATFYTLFCASRPPAFPCMFAPIWAVACAVVMMFCATWKSVWESRPARSRLTVCSA
jgi:hypothetical protein